VTRNFIPWVFAYRLCKQDWSVDEEKEKIYTEKPSKSDLRRAETQSIEGSH
jgi:hypothetical protein